MLARPTIHHSTDFCFETGSQYVALAFLELTMSARLASTPQCGVKGSQHHSWQDPDGPWVFLFTFSTGFRLYIDFITSLLK